MSERRGNDESREARRERWRRTRQELQDTIDRVRARQREYDKLLRRESR